MVGKHSNLRRISGNLCNRDSVRLNIPTTRLSLIYVRWFVTATRLMSRSSNLSSESYDSNRSSQKSLLVCCIARVNFSLPLLHALRVSRNGKMDTMIFIDQSYLYATIRVRSKNTLKRYSKESEISEICRAGSSNNDNAPDIVTK